jgi:hypothetical protein
MVGALTDTAAEPDEGGGDDNDAAENADDGTAPTADGEAEEPLGAGDDATPPATATATGWRWSGASWLPIAVSLLPFAVGMVVLVAVVGGDYHPAHDIAQIELRARDVGRYEVSLGPYSRDGWYHPGPAMFYLLAVPYRLLGSSSVGLGVGALAINGAAVAGMAVVARRRGGTPLLLITLVCCGLLVRSLGQGFLRDPWNPSLPVLAFGLVLFLAWSMTCGDVWALPVGAAVASFVVQTHIGYLALALPLVVWGAVWLVVLAIRRPEVVARRRLARSGLVTVGVLAVLWALPVVQQVTNEPGNLGEAWEYFRLTDDIAHTLGDGWRVLAGQLTLTPEWISGNRVLTISGEPTALYGSAPVPLLLVPLVAAVVVLWRRGPTDARRLLLTLGVAGVLGVLAVARTTGLAFMYRLRWVEVVGMVAGVVVLWAAWEWGRERLAKTAESRQRVGFVTAGLVAVLAVTSAVGAAGAGTPQERESSATAEVLPEVEDALPAEDGVVLIRPSSFGSMLFVPALLLGLERDDIAARIDPISAAVGDHRLYQGGPLRAELIVAVDEDITARLDDPTLELVAQWGEPPEYDPDDPVDAYERAFAAGDTAVLEGFARRTLDESADLRAPFTTRAVAVFLVPETLAET